MACCSSWMRCGSSLWYGVRVVPPAYLPGLRKLCDKHSLLLILDEVRLCRGGGIRVKSGISAGYQSIRDGVYAPKRLVHI